MMQCHVSAKSFADGNDFVRLTGGRHALANTHETKADCEYPTKEAETFHFETAPQRFVHEPAAFRSTIRMT